jgi:hypothetical protein
VPRSNNALGLSARTGKPAWHGDRRKAMLASVFSFPASQQLVSTFRLRVGLVFDFYPAVSVILIDTIFRLATMPSKSWLQISRKNRFPLLRYVGLNLGG